MSESSIRSTKLSVTYYCCWGNTVSWIASSSPPICLLSSIGTIDIGTLDQQRKQSNLNITWTSEECILFLSPIRIALPIIFNIFVLVSAHLSSHCAVKDSGEKEWDESYHWRQELYRIERILDYKLKEIVKVISWLLKAPPQIMSFPSDWVRCKPKIWKNAILDVAILGVPKKV